MKLRIMLMFVISLIAPISLQAAEAGPEPRDQASTLGDRIKDDFFEFLLSRDWSNAQALLDQFPDLINSRDQNGHTPLVLPVRHYRVDMVEWLLVAGADPNAPNVMAGLFYKCDELMELSEKNQRIKGKIIDLLLAAGADTNIKNFLGHTLLDSAAIWKNSLLDICDFHEPFLTEKEKNVLIKVIQSNYHKIMWAGSINQATITHHRLNYYGAILGKPIFEKSILSSQINPSLNLFVSGLLAAQQEALNGNIENLKKLLIPDGKGEQLAVLQRKYSGQDIILAPVAVETAKSLKDLLKYDSQIFSKVALWQDFLKNSNQYRIDLVNLKDELNKAKKQYQQLVGYVPHLYNSFGEPLLDITPSPKIAQSLPKYQGIMAHMPFIVKDLEDGRVALELRQSPKAISLKIPQRLESIELTPLLHSMDLAKWEELVNSLGGNVEAALSVIPKRPSSPLPQSDPVGSASPSPAPQAASSLAAEVVSPSPVQSKWVPKSVKPEEWTALLKELGDDEALAKSFLPREVVSPLPVQPKVSHDVASSSVSAQDRKFWEDAKATLNSYDTETAKMLFSQLDLEKLDRLAEKLREPFWPTLTVEAPKSVVPQLPGR